MSLGDQIRNVPETLSDLALAAECRFRDAEELLTSGRNDGAVYLLGLACEMWLKLACFRLSGGSPSDRVHAFLRPAATWMQSHAAGVEEESYHSLAFWAEYLVLWRQVNGPAMPAHTADEIRVRIASRLFKAWNIQMRYREFGIPDAQAWSVYDDATWLRSVHDQIWR
ncbi:MAG TPA: hypothetical protein VMD30_03750 [Tepidisphaeraceae bacterium]|nr:hypothetical protein [Tepidisphaeraceae bacterium]